MIYGAPRFARFRADKGAIDFTRKTNIGLVQNASKVRHGRRPGNNFGYGKLRSQHDVLPAKPNMDGAGNWPFRIPHGAMR